MSEDICFRNPVNDGLILLPRILLQRMRNRLADRSFGRRVEAGGILLGAYRGPHIEITDCTEPLPLDRQSSHMFDRIDPGHQKQARRLWSSTKETHTYVGEWHTHPGGSLSPSGTDKIGWQKLSRVFEGNCLFFLVLADFGLRGEVGFVGKGRNPSLREAKQIKPTTSDTALWDRLKKPGAVQTREQST
ncbi:MAG: Mov34/MPN/PAD-1 family protein [Magnetovibrionaceae bacterium]